MKESLIASMFVAKYGAIVVLSDLQGPTLFPLLLARMNIFTDPQRPMATSAGIYEIGGPDENSPVFVTTNFSLTYFIVSGEIENSGISAWLIVPQCEGMSVLTAWAAGKFSGSSIAKAISEMDFEKQVKTREIVIPGYVSQISGELEENLKGWKVLVGPQEASDLESFIKTKFAS
jgi:acetyl-CoA decarbonylase/synthase complex subunit gamma